jgi:glycosyltransferase involved in cell wall biosynthesis
MKASFPSGQLRVAALVDLRRGPRSGGHVRCWERLALAASAFPDELDLVVFFSGFGTSPVLVGSNGNVRFETLPPAFGTERLSFLLGKLPDDSDLAPWHPALARRLASGRFDVIHTTDAHFAFARTAAAFRRRTGTVLTNSAHTATPELARAFLDEALLRRFGTGLVGRFLRERLELPKRLEESKRREVARHRASCDGVLVSDAADAERASAIVGSRKVSFLRRGVDRTLFSPSRADRDFMASRFGISPEERVVLFVGRLESSKRPELLASAVALAASRTGTRLRLLCLGEGGGRSGILRASGGLASCPGMVSEDEVGRAMASSDVVCAPSEFEILGNVVQEALASGTPCLVSEKGGMLRIFEGSEAGGEVSGGTEEWAAALEDLLCSGRDSSEIFSTMRSAAISFADERIPTWVDVLREDLLPVWRSALAEASGRRTRR